MIYKIMRSLNIFGKYKKYLLSYLHLNKVFYANCILCIFHVDHYFVKCGLDKSTFCTYFFGKLIFRLFDFALFSTCSVFRFDLHKSYSIYYDHCWYGCKHSVKYSVILFSLYKEQFVMTNIALWKTDHSSWL